MKHGNIISAFVLAAGLFGTQAVMPTTAQAAAQAKAIEIKGEVIDTWCYFSGVMGGEDAVIGSAHHTCALWCAAGGIPVGVRTEVGSSIISRRGF